MFILVIIWRNLTVGYILCDEGKCYFITNDENLKKAKMLGMMPTIIRNILDANHNLSTWVLKRIGIEDQKELLEKDTEFVGELTTDSLSFKVVKCFCTVAREAS